MRIRVGTSTLPIIIGIGFAVTACSSSPPGTGQPAVSQTQSASSAAASASPTASAVASGSAALVPAGYTRVGGVTQGISIATPASWVAVNLATSSIASATKELGLKGISASTAVQDLETMQKLHAVVLYDIATGVKSSQHFTPNISAYCVVSDVTDVGAAGVPLLKQGAAAEFGQSGATHITQKDIEIGGVPGVETSYQLSSSGAGVIDGSQLEVLPKPDKGCFVTLTSGQGQPEGNVLRVAAATAQFP
jgi:hypothetical protein